MILRKLAVLAMFCVSPFVLNSSVAAEEKANPEAYEGLRTLALTVARKDLALPNPKSPATPWGLIMDTAFEEGGSSSVIAFADGTASIYLSSGGGYIGGDGHSKIRHAVSDLMPLAAKYIAEAIPVKSSPLPDKGHSTFYFRTDSGLFAATAPEELLGEGHHKLSPLYFGVQKVITEYRLLAESVEKN